MLTKNWILLSLKTFPDCLLRKILCLSWAVHGKPNMNISIKNLTVCQKQESLHSHLRLPKARIITFALTFTKNKNHCIRIYVYQSTAHSPYKYFSGRLFGSVFQRSICMGYVRPLQSKVLIAAQSSFVNPCLP